jgi:hypothetical protein
MPIEMPNNSPNWKERLEAMNSLPSSFEFDAEGSWNKLYLRLQHPNSKRKSYLGIWLAAAGLAGLVTGLVLLLPGSRNLTGLTSSDRKANSLIPFDHPAVSLKAGSPDAANPGSKENMALISPKRAIIHSTYPIPRPFHHSSHPFLPQMAPMEALSRIQVPEKTDSSTMLTLLTPTRKKLRVVQLNELGLPDYDSGSKMARNNTRFHRNLNTKDFMANSFLEQDYNRTDLIRIKLSPQN